MDIDHIDLYLAGTIVTFQFSRGSVVLAKILVPQSVVITTGPISTFLQPIFTHFHHIYSFSRLIDMDIHFEGACYRT